jgi:hypothetical protein
MMAEWVVVAIPADDNPVWRISSEKVPHMTLLYFGEQNDVEKLHRATEFLQHMVKNSMVRFGLEVDFRGKLGPKDADVLFFHEDFSLRNVQDHRAQMLQQPDMFEMYNSVEQFPSWTPHLTLGYPDAPAKEPNPDYGFPGWIHFDKIALWSDDFSGPEFQIPWNKGMDVDMDLSDPVRHAAFNEAQRKVLAENKQAMSDGSFPIRNVDDLKNAIKAYGRAKDKDKAKAWIIKRAKALKAESQLPEEWMTDTAKQGDVVDDILAHYGIKGMKWGVNRTREQIDSDSPDVKNVKEAKAKIKTNRTTDVLSNKELQSVVTRMNLEQQYDRLTTGNANGKSFVEKLTKQGKTVNDAVQTSRNLQKNLGPLLVAAAAAAAAAQRRRNNSRDGVITPRALYPAEKRQY